MIEFELEMAVNFRYLTITGTLESAFGSMITILVKPNYLVIILMFKVITRPIGGRKSLANTVYSNISESVNLILLLIVIVFQTLKLAT